MKRAALLLAAIIAFSTPLARAQSEDIWTAPNGRFSLAFSANGWTELDPAADDPGSLLGIEHREFQQSGHMRTCFITERRQAVPNDGRLNQAYLNVVTNTMGPGGLERTMGMQSERSEVITVDGVAVIDAAFDGPTRMYMRAFYIKDGADLVQIFMNCGAGSPVEADVEANIIAMMQTLRINPE